MHNSALFPIVLSASTFLFYSALAACTANPDCAALGYTQSACGKGDIVLKCPFDTAKLYCAEVRTNCLIGDYFYSDKTCSAERIEGKIPIGIVYMINRDGSGGRITAMDWVSSSNSYWSADDYNYDLTQACEIFASVDSSKAQQDLDGAKNSRCILSVRDARNKNYEAATLCANYVTAGTKAGDWYLPAAGELYKIYQNYRVIAVHNVGAINAPFWSSSLAGSRQAWMVRTDNGNIKAEMKNFGEYVRCSLLF